MKNNKNLFIIAETNTKKGFDIYLVFSGRKEYLMSHRENKIVYKILADGIRLDELVRSKHKVISMVLQQGKCVSRNKCWKNYSEKVENSINHIIDVVEEYLKYEVFFEDKTVA